MLPSSPSAPTAASPRQRRIEASGTELAVYEWGRPDAPAILLAHGIQDFALTLAPVAEALAADHRVIAYDLRGHGESAHPGIYTMAHHIADLHAVFLDCELDRPIVVGHSLGGQVVAQWAGIFAELPRAVVLIEGLGPPYALNRFPEEVKQKRARNAIESLTHPRKHRLVASKDHARGAPPARPSPPRPGPRPRVRRARHPPPARRRPGMEVGPPGRHDLDVERARGLRGTLVLGHVPSRSS